MFFLKDDRKTLSKIILLIKPLYKKVIIVILSIVLSSVVSLILPLITKNIVDNGLAINNIPEVAKLSAIGFLLLLFQKIIELVETKYCVLINSLFSYDLSKKALKQLMSLEYEYFNKTNFNEIIGNMTMDIGNISRITDKSSFFVLTSIFKVVGGIIGLLLIDWRLTAVAAVSLPVRIILVTKLYKTRRKRYENYMEISREYSAWYGDTISGIREIKLFGLQRLKIGQFIRNQKKLIKTNIKIQMYDKIYEVSEEILFNSITYITYVLGALLLAANKLSIGSIFAFITYCTFVSAHVSTLLGITYGFSSIIPSAKRFFNFLDLDSEAKAKHGIPIKETRLFKSGIAYKNVSFSYGKGQQVLKNISFEIAKGEKIAILGPNGSGKTTILNLLLRLIVPEEGKILLDDKDVQTFRLTEYRQLISSVGQSFYIFNEAIKKNISLFPETNQGMLERAAKLSGAHEYIKDLPQGYESTAGQNGSALSAGQRQKLAMARALYADSDILIFDEATSNYDSESELKLTSLFGSELKGKTIIMVSHKPDLLKAADRIILIDKGEIAGIGNHDELYLNNRWYTDLLDRYEQRDAS